MTADPKYQAGEPPTATQAPPGAIISPDVLRQNRIPPGQVRTRKWPVLQYGAVPHVKKEDWKLSVFGLVERPLEINWEEFSTLPRVKVFSDFHCVTTWSRLGNVWEGVSAAEIMKMAGALPTARFLIAGGYDNGWTTNFPLEYFTAADVLLCDTHDGEPLNQDHGAPVRLIVPQLYAWKSAKWLKSLEFTAQDRRGLWENAGYHDRGDPWLEERYNG